MATWLVVLTGRNYEKTVKRFKESSQDPPNTAERNAREYARKIREKDDKDQYGKYRSIDVSRENDSFQNGRARAEEAINQKMANAGLPSSNNASYDADFKAGQRDKKAGYYDKWYRYNRRDDGEAYDAGFKSVDFPKGKDITIIEENR